MGEKGLDKDKVIRDLIKKVEELTLRVQQLEVFEQENKNLRQENASLKAENAELMSRLNSNSKNSSRPPSSDGYKKKPALPKKVKGKQGGQKGHKGRTLQQVEHPDKTVKCNPGQCDCGHEFLNDELVLSETRQVFDFPQPRLEVTEYQIQKGKCPVCGEWHKGTAPEGINAPVQYGNGVKAFGAGSNHCHYPVKTTAG